MLAYADSISPADSDLIAQIAAITIEKQKRKDTKGQGARRDVHHKELITLPFQMRILNTVPSFLTVGLFAHPATYSGVMQLTAGSFFPGTPDAWPNPHGAAIKIHGVDGAKLLPGDEASTDFDIILADHETFFVPSLDQLLQLARGKYFTLFSRHPETFWKVAASIFRFVPSVLTSPYYSQAPYRLGEIACKYALLPEEESGLASVATLLDPNYLRHEAIARLTHEPARFKLCIQIHRQGESISDSTRSWEGAFIDVAELEIPQLEEGQLLQSGKGLDFNPWRVLPEHRPLSWIGDLRKFVSEADFAWRTQENSDNTT